MPRLPFTSTSQPLPIECEKKPSEIVSACITIALAAYILGLVLTIATHSGSGSSALLDRIKGRIFSPWLVPLWLDVGFHYRLTSGQPADADHVIEVHRTGDSGAGIILFPDNISGERAMRWRRLARAIVTGIDDADREGLLPAAIGAGLFDDLGTKDVSLRVLQQPLPERSTAAVIAPAEVYAARIRSVGGEVQLIKKEARGALAPLVPQQDNP